MKTSSTGSWISSLKATVEFYEMDKEMIVRDAVQRFEENGRTATFWYWTWQPGDREEGLCTLLVWEDAPKAIYTTAPDYDIEEAVIWLHATNTHLQFDKETPYIGFTGDDFAHGRCTAQLHFTLKEPA